VFFPMRPAGAGAHDAGTTTNPRRPTMGSAQVQGKLWGPGARDWAELNEPCCTPFYEAVFDAIAVGPGMVMLDAGCGGGFALQLAAKRGATVTGFDACAPLLDIARERVPAADIRQGDLESLPFAGHTFDAITAFNSVQYAADPAAALRELRRVAKSGALVGIVTWGAPERCESRVILAAIGGLLPPPPPGAEGPFALSAPGKLEELAEAAGLVPEQAGEVPTPFIYPDLATAVRTQLSSGPARLAIEHAGEPSRRQLPPGQRLPVPDRPGVTPSATTAIGGPESPGSSAIQGLPGRWGRRRRPDQV
jgi:SAM-dependent methyltransferase